MFVCKFSLFIYVFPTGPAYAIYVSYADGAICAESAVKHQPANNGCAENAGPENAGPENAGPNRRA